MRWIVSVLVGLVLALSSAAMAQEIPFKLVDNAVLLTVKVNGQPVTARLDTGGDFSLVDPTVAGRLGLTAGGHLSGSGLKARSTRFDTVPSATVTIGNLTVVSDPLILFDMRASDDEPEANVDITLGMDMVRNLVMEIDFDRSIIRFTPSEKYAAPANRPPLKIRRVGSDRSIQASVTNWQSVQADFDTGNPGALQVTASVARTALQDAAMSTGLAAGIDGVVSYRAASVPSFSLAGLTLNKVPTVVGSSKRERIGLGIEILKRFNLILDFAHDRMWMAPNSLAGAPYRKDRLGIWTHSKTWPRPVLLVSPLSPAAQAGIKAGEQVKQIADSSGKTIEDMDGIAAGAQVTVIMADGTRHELVAADYF